MARVSIVVLVLAAATSIRPQLSEPRRPEVTDEVVGVGEVVTTLISIFDRADILALGEAHDRKVDSDVRIALVRHPDFAKKVRTIVIECASTTEQSTLDRYIRGEKVPIASLEKIWKTTTQAANGFCDSSIYLDFLDAVRNVNAKLPVNAQVRVFGGDPGPGDNRSREVAAVSVIKEQALDKNGKVLVIYGAAHFYRNMSSISDYASSMGEDVGLITLLDAKYPGRSFVVIPIGLLDRPPAVAKDVPPDYQKFDKAVTSQVRPILVPLDRSRFGNLSAEEFLGRTLTTCRGSSGCKSVFKGSSLKLGQIADACIYFGWNK